MGVKGLKNILYVVVRLFSNGSRIMSKCGLKEKIGASRITVLCDVSLDRFTVRWNILVLFNKNVVRGDTSVVQ